MLSLVMMIVAVLTTGAAAYFKWQVADLQVELEAAREEAASNHRLFEMEMVKSGSLRAANLELAEKVKRLSGQPQPQSSGVVWGRMPRTIYFN